MSLHEIGLLLVAEALVIGLFWRARHRRRQTERARTGLESPEPEERLQAIDLIARTGVNAHAPKLLAAAGCEQDPAVRAALVDLVARFQWEPVDGPVVAELREWASQEADRLGGLSLTSPVVGLAPRGAGATGGPLIDRVETALGERVSWLSVDDENGSLLVNRPPAGPPEGGD